MVLELQLLTCKLCLYILLGSKTNKVQTNEVGTRKPILYSSLFVRYRLVQFVIIY